MVAMVPDSRSSVLGSAYDCTVWAVHPLRRAASWARPELLLLCVAKRAAAAVLFS